MEEVIIYNPRYFNGKPSKDIAGNFPWADGQWEGIKVNEMKKYPAYVADELLKRYPFLKEVAPENVSELKEEMKKKLYVCDVRGCNYTTTDKQKFQGHKLGAHKMSEKVEKDINEIPSAKGRTVVRRPSQQVSPEQAEGIPDTSLGDVDGWYGPGLEEDSPSSMKVVRPGQSGTFGAA